jgi:hypothetical protein
MLLVRRHALARFITAQQWIGGATALETHERRFGRRATAAEDCYVLVHKIVTNIKYTWLKMHHMKPN